MRTVFFEALKKKMQIDKTIFLVVADMGLGIVEPFEKEFPDRYLNVGIAEQNLIGVSAGLCNAGYRPFCYTISNFLIERCFEQIRNDICLHNYPVTLVGASTGFDNGTLGPTHQVIDDIGCLKVLPNIRIYSPGSINATKLVFDDVIAEKVPAYVRIGKGSVALNRDVLNINHMVHDVENSKILVVTHGNVLEYCIAATAIDSDFSVYCMNKVKPVDVMAFKSLCDRFSTILVVEDQLTSAGLYNSLCQVACGLSIKNTRLISIAPQDCYESVIGDRNFFAEKYGFSPQRLCDTISAIK